MLLLFCVERFFCGFCDEPGRRLHLAALTDVVDHLYSKLFAESNFRNRVALRVTVAAIGEYVRVNRSQGTTHAPVGVARDMVSENDTINTFNCLNYFFAFYPGHKGFTFLIGQPVVVIENHHKLITKRSSLFKHPHVPDVYRVKPARYRHNYQLFHTA